jgi:hypothetical protein
MRMRRIACSREAPQAITPTIESVRRHRVAGVDVRVHAVASRRWYEVIFPGEGVKR